MTIKLLYLQYKLDNMDLHKFVASLDAAERAKLLCILEKQDARITVEDWIELNSDLPNKTLNPLRYMVKYGRGSTKLYMDELTVSDLKSLRNLGAIGIELIVARYPSIK
jgi:hypothetical protein